MESSSKSLINDSVTLQSIRDFLASEKPANMTSTDVNQIVHLLSRKAQDHPIYDSQQTLSKVCACDVKTIVRSQKRLQKLGWLSRPQRRGRTCALSLNYENIPSEKAVQKLISQDAKALVSRYVDELRTKFIRKKFPKHWLGQQRVSAQWLLDRCSGNLELAEKIVKFAVSHPRLQNKAKKGLYELKGQWNRVRLVYDAEHPEAANQPVEAVEHSQTQPTPPQSLQLTPTYAVRRKIVHRGIGLRWDTLTNRIEDLVSGEVIADGEIPLRIMQAGLRQDMLSGQFQDFSTREPFAPDEIQERLMGTEVWQEERTMEEA